MVDIKLLIMKFFYFHRFHQAMIAECVMETEDERYEAMDLFRHATELQFHVCMLLVL